MDPNQHYHEDPKKSKFNLLKTIVLCLDGTTNDFGNLPLTNCLKIFQLLDKQNSSQMCYYQPGVGVKFGSHLMSQDPRNFLSINFKKFGRTMDSIFAFTFEFHVKAAYVFLMKFFQPGDRICLFGFSRGSFAARILTGMLESIGLLNTGLEDMVPTAWEIYCNWEKAGQPGSEEFESSLAADFSRSFCRQGIEIHFMGLFDTVNSVGLLRDRMFPYTSKSNRVNHVRHAISVDERRGKFKQVMFQPFRYFPNLTDLDYQDFDCDNDPTLHASSRHGFTEFFSNIFGKPLSKKEPNCNCNDIKEVWFPGNHGDVGGGWLDEDTNQNLSNLPLRWMISQSIKFGLIFKQGSIKEFDIKFPNLDAFLAYNHDCLKYGKCSPVHDRNINRSVSLATNLPTKPIYGNANSANSSIFEVMFWWLIELLPLGIKLEDSNGEWKNIYVPNLGRPRKMPNDSMLHWSVFYRLHYFKDYNPTNLPPDLGSKFLNLLPREFITDKVKDFATNMTVEKIKENNEIWNQLPNDLNGYL